MKIIPLLARLEQNSVKLKGKTEFRKEVLKGDVVCVIYYDLDKEVIKLKQFGGVCIKMRSKGLNTKIGVRTSMRRISVEQEFFLYSNTCIDVGIIRKK
jgi:ribosomal protein L19